MKRPNIDKSRSLRRNQTGAERKLWTILRDRRLNGIKFRRQFSIDIYILDFYAPEFNLAVEADGGQHYAENAEKDATRAQRLFSRGVHVLRFSNRDILQNIEGVCETILQTIDRGRHPLTLILSP
jgi:very-short-patch-repair endonuclease